MAATKTRKKATTSKAKKPAKKAMKMKAKPAARKPAMKARAAKKPAAKKKIAQPPPRPDQTTVRNGPHHVDRHPVEGGIHVHPAPMSHVPTKRPPVVFRGH